MRRELAQKTAMDFFFVRRHEQLLPHKLHQTSVFNENFSRKSFGAD